MARSQLLKDLVSGSFNVEIILMRLKVILSDLENDTIMAWINGELEGYPNGTLPAYRILTGVAYGTYILNLSAQYRDCPVPLESLLSNDRIDQLETVHIIDSIATIQKMLNEENRDNYARIIPTAYCHKISRRDFQLLGMRIKISANQMDGIVSIVKSKLITVIMELEKQFENLDDLDIRSQVETDPSKKEQIIYQIEQVIGSIKIGNNNKLSNSNIGHKLGEVNSDN